MATEYEFVSWERCYSLCFELYRKVEKSGFSPDVIVGVARGGWVPARILSDLFINRQTANVKVEFYRGIYETSERPRVIQPISWDTRWKRVLVVDDISDTGHSLAATVEHLKVRKPAELRTACLHVKPWTRLKPDYYVASTKAWVVYPWELKEFAFALADKLAGEERTLRDIEGRLVEVGLPRKYVKPFLKQWSRLTNYHVTDRGSKASSSNSGEMSTAALHS